MNEPRSRAIMAGISILYLCLAVLYAAATPPFEASDELWHYPMVQTLATNGLQLPVQDPAVITPWRQEGSQPPLYYLMAAVITSWIDTSDMEYVRRINPHADIGVVRIDGSANMVVHRTAAEAFPWSGTVLAVYVVRAFSILLGLATIWVTYYLGRELFPERRDAALGAAALNAALPMFLFISASVNNDNLSTLLGNLLTLLIIRLALRRAEPHLRDYVLIGITAGLGMLAKFNIGFMLPIIGLTFAIISLRQRTLRPLVIGGLISGGLTIIIAGWWYLRNLQLYGDPTGLNVFLDIVGRRAIPANAAQLWAERHSFTQFFWGGFGGVNIPLPDAVYVVFNLIGGIGLVSGLVFLIAVTVRRAWTTERLLAATITLLWIAANFVSYLRWTSETPASQGRLMFGALSSILIWIVIGWTWFLRPRLQALTLIPIVAWFVVTAAAAPLLVIRPVYQKPLPIPNFDSAVTFADSQGRSIGLGAEVVISPDSAAPGDDVLISLRWQIERAMNRDWSLFAHLISQDGIILAQRDVYPGGGLLATSDMVTGFAWENPVALRIPNTVPAPQTARIVVGWYDHQTGERLLLPDGSETYEVGEISLIPASSPYGEFPNPVSINFGDQMELIGYDIDSLSRLPGDSVRVRLFWRGLRTMPHDYVVFIHVIDPVTTTIYGASDSQPAGWTRPTTTWGAGEIVEDVHTFTVPENTPPGTYEVEIGVYRQLEDAFPRLRIITQDGGMADDYVYLTRLMVRPAATEDTQESDP